MKRIFLSLTIFFLLFSSNLQAEDFSSLWEKLDDDFNMVWMAGYISGLRGGKIATEAYQAIPKSSLDSRQKLISFVLSKAQNIDAKSVVRVINDLYEDSANSQLHYQFLFFPAAARLLGYPEKEINETLILLRQSTVKE